MGQGPYRVLVNSPYPVCPLSPYLRPVNSVCAFQPQAYPPTMVASVPMARPCGVSSNYLAADADADDATCSPDLVPTTLNRLNDKVGLKPDNARVTTLINPQRQAIIRVGEGLKEKDVRVSVAVRQDQFCRSERPCPLRPTI